MTINQTKGTASFIGLIAYVAGLAAITTLIWSLWNILVPTVTGWSHISWIQALGIRVLVSLSSMTIKTSAGFTSKEELANEEFVDIPEASNVTAVKDDDGGYTIKIDFGNSNDVDDEDEDD